LCPFSPAIKLDCLLEELDSLKYGEGPHFLLLPSLVHKQKDLWGKLVSCTQKTVCGEPRNFKLLGCVHAIQQKALENVYKVKKPAFIPWQGVLQLSVQGALIIASL
jgi:hypothetical protein